MNAQIEMPKYRCHKEVHALKIASVNQLGRIVPADEGYAAFDVDAAWMQKHNPKEGGYYVVYADGYASFSPSQAFEEGYTRI